MPELTEKDLRALKAAGALLQSKEWPGGKVTIKTQPGESYPQAVQRVAKALPEDQRQHLRELVSWVLEYEAGELGEV